MVLDASAKKWLLSRFRESVKFNEPMSKHTSLRVGGPANVYIEPETIHKLMMLIDWSGKNKIPYFVVGAGTNLLVTDDGISGIVVVLNQCLNTIHQAGRENDCVYVKALAGVKLQTLCWHAVRNGLAGLNFALGIPGTVGGGIIMNAGTARGCIADVVTAITVLHPNGDVRRLKKDALDFSYRSLSLGGLDDDNPSIILDSCFCLRPARVDKLKDEAKEILDCRKNREPTGSRSAGCMFKNPSPDKPAGRLIDQGGLKGRKIGGAEISHKHANYIINGGNASAADILALMSLARETVKKQFDVDLTPEVKVLGD
jgi:UDP-N-acetylmuramate dehydrogenase